MKLTLAAAAVMVAIYIIITYIIHKKGKYEQSYRYPDKDRELLIEAGKQAVLKHIFDVQEITNEQELKVALLRVKALWNKEHGDEYSHELNKLIDYICEYELKTMGYNDV